MTEVASFSKHGGHLHHQSAGGGGDNRNTPLPVWKTYLYQLQLQAPPPRPVPCQKNIPNRPSFYGLEYHGMIDRMEAEQLLGNEDGNFLVRESNNPPGSFTLAIKFNNETKNYKVYYDGAFYVGEKRFDNISDLVHDGLISFYIEKHASNYIAMMAEESNYAESPYVASRIALLSARQQENQKPTTSSNTQAQSIHSSFMKQQQQQQFGSSSVQQVTDLAMQQGGDKDNRHFLMSNNGSTASPAACDFRSIQHQHSHHQSITAGLNFPGNNAPKSNAIFDRFDIINSEKPHRFKQQNFKGPHWCDFCLNFMWGLVSQGVKCQDCGFQAHKKCSERAPPDCEPQMRFIKRVFGVDLTTLVKATSSIRPIVVEKCIEEIEKRKGALECEGLYRVSGFSDTIEELKMAFDRGDNIDFSEFKYVDIHIICSLLKLYLRQLPIPLITFEVYTKLMECLNINASKSNMIEMIRACVIELPPAHYLTLKFLIEHLVKVTLYSSKNQMSPENLAIVFAPTLMRPINPDPVQALKNTHKEQKLVETLIANAAQIFEK